MADQEPRPPRRTRAPAETVLDTLPLGVLMVDRTGRITWANGRAEALFGYAHGALVGLEVEALLPERFRAAHVGHRAGYFAAPRVRPMGLGLDLAARRRDGSEFPVEISLSFTDGHDGPLALAFVMDITPRMDAERRLQAEFAITRLLADGPPADSLPARVLEAVGVALAWDAGELWRVDGAALWREAGWNRPGLDTAPLEAARRGATLGPGAGLPGRTWAADGALGTTDLERELGGPGAAAAAGLGLRTACAFPIRSDRATLAVVTLLTRDRRAPGDELLGLLTDVGRRIGDHLRHRQVEEELARQRDLLYQREKLAALGHLVAGVAHEMNNPLGIISSRIELMLTEGGSQALPPQQREDLQVIHRNVLRVAGVAGALRSFARQSTGERHPIDLNAVVGETLLLVGKATGTHSVRITTALAPALPPILGDANALQQVLLNLLTNAREAMAAGGGEIRVETGPAPDRPGCLRLTVSDTGPGIPARDLPQLFEPFFTTKPAGTGLGLAVSYGIVQDHQGTIEAVSPPGQGATFILTLPAAPPA